ncbi:MAG: ion transporter, partial [Alphaproteobacteria bacterium]|nr:ion transporter [Alphaproteobacteria bacterium]
GTIGASTYSLFQIMTLESWSMGIVRPVMEVYPQAWIFFITFILLTTFAVLNLFIAIIVDAMTQEHQEEEEASRSVLGSDHDQIMAELRALRGELAEMRGQNRV